MKMLKLLAFVVLTAGSHGATVPFCKSNPASSQWPSAEQWHTLNISVSGALQIPAVPAAACHSNQAAFNNSTCQAVVANWTNTDWVAQNPQLADYNDDTCLPNSTAPCSSAGYPAYVVEATSANDVAAGVKFAKDHQVRLIVKGTGHDFPGRSSGPGSLSIWTHKLQGTEVTMAQPKAIQYGGVAAMKIFAGMRWGEIYKAAVSHNLTVIGGSDPHVGVGGWISGGGHGPLTAKYGMGSDQVLEMDVVTANGDIVTIDENHHADLFWALRGGGGSTFAVITSVTVKAYPSLPVGQYAFSYNTTSASDTFWSMAAHFHAELPRISNAGGMGYYNIYPTGEDINAVGQGQIDGIWIFPEKSQDEVNAIVKPFADNLNSGPSWASDKIAAGGITTSVSDFLTSWLVESLPASGGYSGRLGSWLFDGPSLTSNLNLTAARLREVTPEPWWLIGHLVAGPGTHNVTIPGNSSAVLPAWREAYAHLIAPRFWTSLNTTMKNELTQSLRTEVVPTLKSLAPDSGGYMNENDPTNPNWKSDYYGSNYERLLEIKHKWDPEGVFWCKPCVGYDEWQVLEGPSQENPENWGVAQVGGNICKA